MLVVLGTDNEIFKLANIFAPDEIPTNIPCSWANFCLIVWTSSKSISIIRKRSFLLINLGITPTAVAWILCGINFPWKISQPLGWTPTILVLGLISLSLLLIPPIVPPLPILEIK